MQHMPFKKEELKSRRDVFLAVKVREEGRQVAGRFVAQPEFAHVLSLLA
jgi:hypothetical protein